jgi:hypothetical protein
MKSFRQFLPLALLAALAACGSDSTGPKNPGNSGGKSGSVRFSYTGGGTSGGTFKAEGAMPASGDLGNWAGGARFDDDEDSAIVLTGATRQGSKYNTMAIQLDGNTAGTYTFDSDCNVRCAYGAIAFGLSSWTDTADRACVLTEGQVTLTTISATQAKGTFSGEGVCLSGGSTIESFQVTGGTFDLPLADIQG